MLKQQTLWAAIFFLGLGMLGGAQGEQKQAASAADGYSTKTVTHIEYNRLGFMKMDFPKDESDHWWVRNARHMHEDQHDLHGSAQKGQKTEIRRDVTFLDLGLLCVYKHRDRGQGQFHEDYLDIPLAELYERTNMKDRKSHKFLDLPLLTVFRSNRRTNGAVDVVALDGPLVKLYNRKRQPDGDDDWTFVQIPFFSLLQRHKSERASSLSFVKIFWIDVIKWENRNGKGRLRFFN